MFVTHKRKLSGIWYPESGIQNRKPCGFRGRFRRNALPAIIEDGHIRLPKAQEAKITGSINLSVAEPYHC